LNNTSPHTVRDHVLWTETQFTAAKLYFGHGTDNALDEAAWLVGSALGLPPQNLDAHLDDTPDPAGRARIRALAAERIRTRQPLAYLLKEAWFAGERYFVDERVLVPRSLVGEFILERFQPWIKPEEIHRALDLCTGSGCIALALARAFPQTQVDATDISAAALAVARINVERHGLQERVRLIESDLFAALAGERYDLIVTNPPYVARAELATLPEEYRREPSLALVSGPDGLDAVRRILAAAADHLQLPGVLVAEVGNSHVALAAAFPEVPFLWLTTASGDDSVFLLTAAQLRQHRTVFSVRT
jgi:ribosomal protein L3 glutamine methyltransferase